MNYLTVAGYANKSTSNQEKRVDEFIHVIGKDIARFHCMYWPAFLFAAGMPFPKRVISHGHWLSNNFKMSKSLGNVVDPVEIIKEFGSDSTRSYILKEGPHNKDSDFNVELLKVHHNYVICDGYMNLLNRISGKKIWQGRS